MIYTNNEFKWSISLGSSSTGNNVLLKCWDHDGQQISIPIPPINAINIAKQIQNIAQNILENKNTKIDQAGYYVQLLKTIINDTLYSASLFFQKPELAKSILYFEHKKTKVLLRVFLTERNTPLLVEFQHYAPQKLDLNFPETNNEVISNVAPNFIITNDGFEISFSDNNENETEINDIVSCCYSNEQITKIKFKNITPVSKNDVIDKIRSC